ncbi:MAG: hypothetical protein ABMA15_23535, partial [Vicinamibacterales bacterium]
MARPSVSHVGWLTLIGLMLTTVIVPLRPTRVMAQSATADDYLGLIDAYQAGDTRRAAEALSNQEDKWVESAQAEVLRHAASWPRGRIEAGVLLHTEAVTAGWVLPSHVQVQLGAARRLLALSRGTDPQRFRRNWLLAICWHFQSGLELGMMLPWVDELRDLRGDDPDVDLVAGMLYEAVGWSSPLPDDLPWTSRSRTLGAIPHRTQAEALEAAVAAFQRAARHPATRDEASVRLGRVLAELGRAQASRTVLTPLIEGATERRWRYLAALFVAMAEARAGNAAAEAAAYNRAAAIMPGCQTP